MCSRAPFNNALQSNNAHSLTQWVQFPPSHLYSKLFTKIFFFLNHALILHFTCEMRERTTRPPRPCAPIQATLPPLSTFCPLKRVRHLSPSLLPYTATTSDATLLIQQWDSGRTKQREHQTYFAESHETSNNYELLFVSCRTMLPLPPHPPRHPFHLKLRNTMALCSSRV